MIKVDENDPVGGEQNFFIYSQEECLQLQFEN